MLIIPAIDLMGGTCVRLLHGRFDQATAYGDPFEQLEIFERAGAEWVHIVDLDGAKDGSPAQHDLIGRLVRKTRLKVQCGGGVRSEAQIEALLAAGAARVVVGSAAIRMAPQCKDWVAKFGLDRVVCAFDVRPLGDDFDIATEGWTQSSGLGLKALFDLYPPGSLRHALITDISRDGALVGPNVALMRRVVAERPDIAWQASGGVASVNNIPPVRAAGASATIIGRALYEGRVKLEDALAR
jgi:phosphoribosylformimino-5-aminoimidazole carboxamide ribotide isomerase